MMEGPGADSEEKREPASDIDTVPVDSLKALDPNRPIREADMPGGPNGPLASLPSRLSPSTIRNGEAVILHWPVSSAA